VGPDHPDVAAILNSLAAIDLDRADYAEAEARFGRSARILDAVEGDHPDLARVRIEALCNLGPVLRMRGRYAEAEPILRRALALAALRAPPRRALLGMVRGGRPGAGPRSWRGVRPEEGPAAPRPPALASTPPDPRLSHPPRGRDPGGAAFPPPLRRDPRGGP